MAKGGLLNPFQRRGQAVERNWIFFLARRFESCRAHVNGEERETVATPVVLIEDGITFLSQRELDDYRDQQIQMAWQAGAYA